MEILHTLRMEPDPAMGAYVIGECLEHDWQFVGTSRPDVVNHFMEHADGV